ncbi:hypothetical protein CP533_0741 [Ophiocordyceps camponoti-saundersi (nom. inval.)]|nr:hypothetical protein CP533_0741 [Ophiocordyceps camponoti-saundersi (nom. inval.)]
MDPIRGSRRVAPDATPPTASTAGPTSPPQQPFRGPRPRLSMPPLGSEDSGSEPDVSVLAAVSRAAAADAGAAGAYAEAEAEAMDDDDQVLDHYEAEDTSVEEQVEEEQNEEALPLVDPLSIGLKEISNLGKFTVSSHKPGCGVEELRSEDLKLYWQSDGPQPHKLTVYFVKRVGIREIRFFVDYHQDESYTPTKMVFKSGTSENNLMEFASMTLESPVGWQQVPLAGTGGEPDGNTLVSYVLQMQVLENHQNGKDTHLRSIKIYAFDGDATVHKGVDGDGNDDDDDVDVDDANADDDDDDDDNIGGVFKDDGLGDVVRALASARLEPGEAGFTLPDFMREPEIR